MNVYIPIETIPRQKYGIIDEKSVVKGVARILIVDDEEILRELGEKTLESLGYEVATCKDGQEAVKYYKKNWKEIDLVILDMVMPNMDGREAFIAMKRINPSIRAILSSGYSLNEEAQNILDEGVICFIQKPFNIKRLSQQIADALQV